jgi:hypothetical protein
MGTELADPAAWPVLGAPSAELEYVLWRKETRRPRSTRGRGA